MMYFLAVNTIHNHTIVDSASEGCRLKYNDCDRMNRRTFSEQDETVDQVAMNGKEAWEGSYGMDAVTLRTVRSNKIVEH